MVKGEGVYALLAHGIQSEPGPRSRSFDFDSRSQGNTVISHDNDAAAGLTLDNTFSQLTSDGLYAGDFSLTNETYDGIGIDYRMVLQIEGKGYVRELEASQISCVDSFTTASKKEICSIARESEKEVERLDAVVVGQGKRLAKLEAMLARLLAQEDEKEEKPVSTS